MSLSPLIFTLYRRLLVEKKMNQTSKELVAAALITRGGAESLFAITI